MRIIVKGKNYEVPEEVREYAERKLRRLERLLDDQTDVTVELSVEQHRSIQDSHLVDVTLVMHGQTLRRSAAATTHQAGIDDVIDKVERRAVTFRETSRVRKSSETVRGAGGGGTEPDAGEAASEDGRRIVKVKRFAIEPMFEEDAVAQMEELGHTFFVYVDAESERVHILYRRNDGDLGLIEPIVGGEYTKGRGRAANRSNGRH